MAITPSFLTVILPIVGVLCGAALQFVFSRSTEAYKHERSIRHQAYADYLRAIAKLARSQSQEDRDKSLGELADAKARIAIYSSSSVINALAEFDKTGPSLKTEPEHAAFIHLIVQMRERQKKVAINSLRQVLLGKLQGEIAAGPDAST